MNSEESRKFNEILSKGYQDLLNNKPDDPLRYFLQYLTKNISKVTLDIEDDLREFKRQFEEAQFNSNAIEKSNK